jgi:hypothetical protein
MLTLPFFEDFPHFVSNSLFIAGFCDRDKAPDTPVTVSCKEKLSIASHNSLLIVLLDLCEQNVLVLDEEWVGRLLGL